MRNTTEQSIEHYRDMVNTLDAWIANNEDLKYTRTDEHEIELDALKHVRKKTLRLIGFLERKAGK